MLTAGCAAPGGSAPQPDAGAPSRLSRVPPSPLSPSGPPKRPSDDQPADRIAGRVTRGGAGPCYAVITDDGQEYALYGPTAGTLRTGGYVRVRLGPPVPEADCGPGTPAAIVSVEPVE